MRVQNSMPHGSSLESVQKDGWHLNGSQDKKDWRRNAPDIESSLHWREEERETGLLGRRERRKEGDRENEYRKSERRADNVYVRETSDPRSIPSSDRWHEVSNRNSGHESRRDSKWSSRWGPEDKTKDSRAEKKVDPDKEDTHNEKQYFFGSNVAPSESDPSDKWRPRHRMEPQSGGSTVYRSAPGFGLDKGRVDGHTTGFAPGRGRSNLVRSFPIGNPPSAGLLGAIPINTSGSTLGISGSSADAFRYPRGKLLDIYRKHKKFSSFSTVPEGLEEVPLITHSNLHEPLAFVTPDPDEEALLQDILKGKITSSEASPRSSREKMLLGNVIETGDDGVMIVDSRPSMDTTEGNSESFAKSRSYDSHSKHGGVSCIEEHETAEMHSLPLASSKADDTRKNQICESCSYMVSEAIGVGLTGLASQFNNKFEDKEMGASLDIHTKLPKDPSNLFGSSFFKDPINMNELYQENNSEIKRQQDIPPADLSLFYQDPQGEIQGPFLGVDIISWFDQGFFGTDLPVCLSDVPEGTPFRQLGEVMPHLMLRAQPVSVVNCVDKSESQIAGGFDLEGSAFMSDVASNTLSEWQGAPSEKDIILDQNGQSDLSWHDDLIDLNDGGFPHSKLDSSGGTVSAGKQMFNELAGPDEEEVLYSGRTAGSNRNLLLKPAAGLHDLGHDLNVHHFHTSEIGESLPDHTVPMDNDLHPHGVFWSGLEGAHLKHPPSSSSSAIGDQDHLLYTEIGRDTSSVGRQQEPLGAVADFSSIHDPWLNVHGRNRMQSPNVLQDAIDDNRLSHLEEESSQLILDDYLLSQQLQKQHIQRQNVLSPNQQLHLSGSFFDQLQGSHQQQLQKQHIPQQNLLPSHQQLQLSGSLSYQSQGSHRQQSVNQSVPMLEQLLKLQFQGEQLLQLQHRQRQLQQQQNLQHAQELHHHSMRLLQQHQHLPQQQQPQQSHMQQLLFEQLLQQQMHEPSIGPPQPEPIRGNNMLDEVLFREHLLHELQQQSLHPLRRHDPSLERLIQAKFGHGLRQQPDDMLEVLSHPKHRQTLLDQQLLNLQHEQLQAQQFPGGSRQLLGIDEERNVGGLWSADESGQLVMASAGQHQSHSMGANRLDLLQRQQRQSLFEQLNPIDRNMTSCEHIQHGIYEPSPQPFEMQLPSPVSAHGLNMELVSQFHGLDLQDRLGHMHSSVQMSQFPSSIHSHHQQIPEKFNTSQMDAIDSCWPEHDGWSPNSLIESQFDQLRLERERHRRDLKMNLGPEESNTWTAAGNVEKSKHAMDVLHKSLNVHPLQSLETVDTPVSSYEIREAAWPFSRAASDHPFNLLPVQSSLGDPFTEGNHGHKRGQVLQEQLTNVGSEGHATSVESGERLSYLSSSGALMDEQFLANVNETEHTLFTYSSVAGSLSEETMGFLEPKEGKTAKKHGSKGGGMGLHNFEMGVENSHSEELINDRLPGFTLPKGSENSLLNRPQGLHIISSQELATVPTMMGKDNNLSSSEGRQDPGGDILEFQSPEITAPVKESFLDMLKSTKKPSPEADSAAGVLESDGGLGARSNKKKGKKGRQIDPSLLGFKVHSNRILMGEIQRPNE